MAVLLATPSLFVDWRGLSIVVQALKPFATSRAGLALAGALVMSVVCPATADAAR
jgi:hypothetical protein